MMSPESYPTLFPFSPATVWHASTGLPLSYAPMVLGHARCLYPLSTSSRRRLPRCRSTDEKRTSSFTIDAILGLREAEVKNYKEKQDLEDEVDDLASRQTRFEGVGKLPNRRDATVFSPKLPAGHMAFVPGCLGPLSGGDEHTVRRSRLKGETVKDSTFKGSNEDFKFLGSYGTVESCRQGIGRDDSCAGLKRSTVTQLSWTDEAVHEQTKPKRVRTIFTQDQLDRLESEFSRQQYMVGTERLYLASQLDLSESQVKVWFQNRRIKWRKHNLEQQQQKLAKYRALRDKERKSLQCDDDPKVNDRFDVTADANITEENVCQDKERKTVMKGTHASGEEKGSCDPAAERTSSSNYLFQTHELSA